CPRVSRQVATVQLKRPEQTDPKMAGAPAPPSRQQLSSKQIRCPKALVRNTVAMFSSLRIGGPASHKLRKTWGRTDGGRNYVRGYGHHYDRSPTHDYEPRWSWKPTRRKLVFRSAWGHEAR